ncbi:MAG: GNAT family N-acetyltransferase [Candidatus Acidiferrales bacterium]
MDAEPQIRLAAPRDTDAIVRLVNDAFRLAESFFVEGDRINAEKLRPMMDRGAFLLAEDGKRIAACVYVELRAAGRAYFGLLAVDPARQRRGLGRRLVQEAENYARRAGCGTMEIQTVNIRPELPIIYRAMGYIETGTAPFPPDVRTKLPCHFVLMSKSLA